MHGKKQFILSAYVWETSHKIVEWSTNDRNILAKSRNLKSLLNLLYILVKVSYKNNARTCYQNYL